jgi:hypothetical protein
MKSSAVLFFLIIAFNCSPAQTIEILKPVLTPINGGVAPVTPVFKIQTTVYLSPNLQPLKVVRAAPIPARAAKPAIAVRPYVASRFDSSRATKGDRTDGGDTIEAPKSYCYVINSTRFKQIFYASYDNASWQPITAYSDVTIAIYVKYYVYLKIWDSASNHYHHLIGYPSKYYRIK